MFAQAFPDFEPPDDAMKERVRSVVWGKSYVDTPKLPHERKKDAHLVDYLGERESGIAFFWVMVDTYEEWREKNFEEPERTEEEMGTQEALVPMFDMKNVLEEEYVLTGRTGIGGDVVPFDELQTYLEGKGYTEGRTKLIRELTALGLPTAQKKVNRKTIQVRMGIRKAREDEM